MKVLKKLVALINREVSTENGSQYFVVVQRWLYCLMIGYYLVYIGVCFACGFHRCVNWIPAGILMMAAGLYLSYHYSEKIMLSAYIFMMAGWAILSVHSFGWSAGGQHFLVPMLVMIFFCVQFNDLEKIVSMLLILGLRIGLFLYSRQHVMLYSIEGTPLVVIQIMNSVTLFAAMTIICISFSSNIQASEIQLLDVNKRLRVQANTDQLTKLPNRRYMTAMIEEWLRKNQTGYFSVAMADIDFFKKVNDTYGHDCGDETLKALAALFEQEMAGKGHACRWGGEEFFFFFPNMNLDEASAACLDLSMRIHKLRIPYKDQTIRVTMTFGVEESDYDSWDMTEVVKRADDKLYLGKQQGRDRVVA